MTAPQTCATCGATIAADAPGGACPKCMFQAGFATGGSSPAPDARVPTPEELAPKFPGLVIHEFIGRGGMGVVYRARHKALDREVALKILPASVAGDRNFADRFQREARALAKLQHPNIVSVHDFGRTACGDDGDVFWLVMEFVDGTDIRQAMKAGQVGPKEALAIVPQICDALQYAHEHGVVHRDIKPENVMLDRAGRVKVADFGLAKLMEHGPADASLTVAGQVMGTPHYMAPEQWEKPATVDHRADIYSLGVVFYEMLTGELPLGRFEPPSARVQVDVRLDEVVMRSLEKSPDRRYQHVSEVKTDVGRVADGPPPAPAAPLPVAPTSDGFIRHALLTLLLVAGCVGLLCASSLSDETQGPIAAVSMILLAIPAWMTMRKKLRPAATATRVRRWSFETTTVLAVAALACVVFATSVNGYARLVIAAVALGVLGARTLGAWARRSRPQVARVFAFDSDAEKARGGRLSKMAVAGAFVLPFVVVLPIVAKMLVFLFGGQLSIGPGEVGFLVATLLLGWLVSIFAWVRISHSGDKLRGRAWAAVGTFLPVIAGCPLGLALAFTGRDEQARHDAENAVISQINERAKTVQDDSTSHTASEQLNALWGRAQSLPQIPSIVEVSDLYAELPKELLNGNAARVHDGDFGLPLTDASRLPAPRSALRIDTCMNRRTAFLAASTVENRSVWFGLRRSPGVWHFEPTPVVVADWTAWDAIDTMGTIDSDALVKVEVVELLMRLRQVWPVKSPEDVRSLYPRTEVAAERDLAAGANGSLGLPLISSQQLGESLCGFDVASVVRGPDREHALVTLRHWRTKAGVRFRIVRQSYIVGDWYHVWCFAREPIER